MRIYLIGLPGSGKSTLGPPLAKALNLPFVDLDEAIVNSTGKSISVIFENEGEDRFREIEHQELLKIHSQFDAYLLSTGGGTPCFYDHMSWMNKQGLTIFLDITVETIVSRLHQDQSRPLLAQNNLHDRLDRLYQDRLPIYNKSKLTWTAPILSQPMKLLTKLIREAV